MYESNLFRHGAYGIKWRRTYFGKAAKDLTDSAALLAGIIRLRQLFPFLKTRGSAQSPGCSLNRMVELG